MANASQSAVLREARPWGLPISRNHAHALFDLSRRLVFNEKVTERCLFHGLVHAVQFEVLGLERYTELFVRGFINTKLHFSVRLRLMLFRLSRNSWAHARTVFRRRSDSSLVKQGRY